MKKYKLIYEGHAYRLTVVRDNIVTDCGIPLRGASLAEVRKWAGLVGAKVIEVKPKSRKGKKCA